MAKGYLIGRRGVEAIKRLVNTSTLTPPGATGAKLIESLRFPAPFTIRWSTEVSGWIIALGDVTYSGEAVKIVDVDDSEQYPSPWKKISSIAADESGEIYLNIFGIPDEKEKDSESAAGDEDKEGISGRFSCGAKSDADLAVRIATVDKNVETGEVKIIQHVTSALHLGGSALGVKSLNELKGDIEIIGGDEIEVTTEGQRIIIGYKKGKPADDPSDDPSEDRDPCDHDSAGSAGGVKPDDGAGPGADGNVDPSAGGVLAEGENHIGDNDCNCE